MDEFQRLPLTVRMEVRFRALVLLRGERMLSSGVTHACAYAAAANNLPMKTVRRWFYAAKKSGWRGLVDRRRARV
jgi:hypothetical protein